MAGLDIAPALETGTLRATATFQDPDVRLREADKDAPPRVLVEEGGVAVELEFPDHGSLRRFQRRVAALRSTASRRRS
jgi:hypothetical protein